MAFHLLLLLLFSAGALASNAAVHTLPGCPDKCGNLTIPYPFGTAAGCYRPGFMLTCNDSYNPPKAFIDTTNIEVADVALDTVTIYGLIARDCYAPLGLGPDIHLISTNVTSLPYTFSYTRNRFTALGCDTVALNYRDSLLDYSTGCVAFCNDKSSIINGTCSGIGCCQTAIPKGLKSISTVLRSLKNHTTTWNFSPCSYAFLVDQEQFVFNVTDLYSFYSRSSVPMVMDWAIGEQTCEAVLQFSSNYACGDNSYCSNSTNGPGYRCVCNNGYTGNPYLAHGCQDINECEDPATNPCIEVCTNTPGSYICSCPNGFYGDGKKTGNGCIKETKRFPVTQVIVGSGLGFLFILVSGSWLFWGLKKRRMIRRKEELFKQNGGLLMQQKISSTEGAGETARIFTAAELERATDNYSDSRILGQGGYGVVYKGILPDNRVVAIKKSRSVDESQIEPFINEVVILSQVIHKNVVRLFGCCLETPVPLLVYECVPNGTLHDHIHGNDRASSLSWETRLRIAAETAGALAYLHTATARPIFHRDVKSANILLDNNYMAKVSDFGASRLIPLDRAQITTLVQGTLGYLDPEYFQTGQLTEKSDVYSFGVVLAELLTGRKPLLQSRTEEEQNLATLFLSHMRENRLFDILEPRVRNEGSQEQLVQVAQVTRRCLRLKGEERPTMKEVAAELENQRSQRVHSWVQESSAEDASLLEESTTMYATATELLDMPMRMLSLEVQR